MPRAFMDETGFKIAKDGFDARTTSEVNILFSSSASMLAQYITGIVTLSSSGDYDGGYNKGTVSFGKTYARPPICFVGPIFASGTKVDITIMGDQGSLSYRPSLFWVTSTTSLTIYCRKSGSPWFGSGSTSARYYIMENTIQ